MERKQFEWGKDPIENYLAVYDWHWTENRPDYADYLPKLREIVYAAIAEEARWMEKEEQEAWFGRHTEEGEDKSLAVVAAAKDILGVEAMDGWTFEKLQKQTKIALVDLFEVFINWYMQCYYTGWSWPEKKEGQETEDLYALFGLRLPDQVPVPEFLIDKICEDPRRETIPSLQFFSRGKLIEAIETRYYRIASDKARPYIHLPVPQLRQFIKERTNTRLSWAHYRLLQAISFLRDDIPHPQFAVSTDPGVHQMCARIYYQTLRHYQRRTAIIQSIMSATLEQKQTKNEKLQYFR